MQDARGTCPGPCYPSRPGVGCGRTCWTYFHLEGGGSEWPEAGGHTPRLCTPESQAKGMGWRLAEGLGYWGGEARTLEKPGLPCSEPLPCFEGASSWVFQNSHSPVVLFSGMAFGGRQRCAGGEAVGEGLSWALLFAVVALHCQPGWPDLRSPRSSFLGPLEAVRGGSSWGQGAQASCLLFSCVAFIGGPI